MEPENISIGVNVWVPGSDLDTCLEMAIKMWCHEEPEEVKAFVAMMKEKKDGLHRKDGMSKDKTWKEYLEIPITLHVRVGHMTHRDYMLDRQILERLKYFLQGIIPYEKNDSMVVV